jgi:hypothetical protein
MHQLDSYRWCGHAGILGNTVIQGQETDEVLLMFGQDHKRAREKYREFVAEGIPLGRRDELVGGGIKRQLLLSGSHEFQAYDERILGSGEFVEQLWHESETTQPRMETSPPSLQEITDEVATVYGIEPATLRQGSKQKEMANARAVIAFLAVRRFGYTGVQVAKGLALSPSGVVVAAQRGEAIFAMTAELRNLFPRSASSHSDLNHSDD